ncbi:hypothetical protein ACWIG5_36285 [Streptomyces lydicus]
MTTSPEIEPAVDAVEAELVEQTKTPGAAVGASDSTTTMVLVALKQHAEEHIAVSRPYKAKVSYVPLGLGHRRKEGEQQPSGAARVVHPLGAGALSRPRLCALRWSARVVSSVASRPRHISYTVAVSQNAAAGYDRT